MRRLNIGAVVRVLTLVVVFLFLGACTPIEAIKTAASIIAKPILGLAVKDANTTLAWVETEVKAGRLAPVNADLAKRCPEAIIALSALRTRMDEEASRVDGFRGLVYYGTLNRYGQGVQAEAGLYLKDLAQSCLPLIPAEKLMKIF